MQAEPDSIIILIGNQKDREADRAVTQDMAQQFMKQKNIHFHFETSAKTGENVENLFLVAAKMLYLKH